MTANEAANLIHDQFPQLEGMEVTFLGEGTDHAAFEVGGRYVFRFPHRDEGADALALETRLTAWLAPRLPLKIPRYQFLGQLSPSFPRAFAGYPKISGTPALELHPYPTNFAATGQRLGAFLRILHGLEVHEALRLGVPQDDDPTLEQWSGEARSGLHFLVEHGYLESGQNKHWEKILAKPPKLERRLSKVMHGDFAAEHVLLDAQGTPCGVIDWSDALVGDPAQDLAGLLHWGGMPLLSSALETYGDLEAEALERAQWYAACRAFADIRYGQTKQLERYVTAGKQALKWLERQ